MCPVRNVTYVSGRSSIEKQSRGLELAGRRLGRFSPLQWFASNAARPKISNPVAYSNEEQLVRLAGFPGVDPKSTGRPKETRSP
jgi:hypothetical protein